jgi:hypothetical protein
MASKRILLGCPHGGAVLGVAQAGKQSPDGRLVEGVYCRDVACEAVRDLRLSGVDADMVFSGAEHCGKVKLGSKYVAKWRYLNWLYTKVKFSYIEIHTNAAGNDGWYDNRGPRFFISKNAGKKTQELTGWLERSFMKVPLGEHQLRKTSKMNVLHQTKFPSVLVELFFHTSKADVDFALSPAGVWTYKRALVDGIRGYLGEVS